MTSLSLRASSLGAPNVGFANGIPNPGLRRYLPQPAGSQCSVLAIADCSLPSLPVGSGVVGRGAPVDSIWEMSPGSNPTAPILGALP